MIQHIFNNCGIAVQTVPVPPDFEGDPPKTIVIQDNATADTWLFTFSGELAKKIGGQLMGLGDLEVIGNGKGVVDVLGARRDSKDKPRPPRAS